MGNHIRGIQWYHSGPSGVTFNQGYGPQFAETAYISNVNRAKYDKYGAQVAGPRKKLFP